MDIESIHYIQIYSADSHWCFFKISIVHPKPLKVKVHVVSLIVVVEHIREVLIFHLEHLLLDLLTNQV